MTDSLRERVARAILAEMEAQMLGKVRLDPADFPRVLSIADAALAAIEASGTHVVVPVEPTIEMCDAATRSTSAFMALEQRGADLRRLKHNIRYRAMLAACPRDISPADKEDHG